MDEGPAPRVPASTAHAPVLPSRPGVAAPDDPTKFRELTDTSYVQRLTEGFPFQYALRCTKGKKPFSPTCPNQDNYSLTKLPNSVLLLAICDGHGPFGHWVSFRLAQSLPYFIAQRGPKNLPA